MSISTELYSKAKGRSVTLVPLCIKKNSILDITPTAFGLLTCDLVPR